MSKFDQLAKQWDMNPFVVETNMKFVDSIKQYLITSDIKSIDDFNMLDYGSGSGLVSFALASDLNSIIGMDNSKGMVNRFNEKAKELSLDNLKAIEHNFNTDTIDDKYDLITTNMTMHHIKDYKKFISILANSLNENGVLAISDLEVEDGTFHSDNDGVEHFGFDKEKIKKIFQDINLKNIIVEDVQQIEKNEHIYKIFAIFGTYSNTY